MKVNATAGWEAPARLAPLAVLPGGTLIGWAGDWLLSLNTTSGELNRLRQVPSMWAARVCDLGDNTTGGRRARGERGGG